MSAKKVTFWASDFETTVWDEETIQKMGHEQDETEVWSAASVKLYDDTEDVKIQQSIRDFVRFTVNLKGHNVFYFHNLSFDGSFLVDFFLRDGWKWTNVKDKQMRSGEFKTSISMMGAWYTMKYKKGKTLVEIRNSLKLIPSSLRSIAKSFHTKHQKLDMVYEGDRRAYCEIKAEELAYIKNDVLVLKEALEKMFDEGHDKLTIGSCCMDEFKKCFDKYEYQRMFPDLRDYPIVSADDTLTDAWEFCHKAYHGGWCYVNPAYKGIPVNVGQVNDVNSLYPSVMHSSSGNAYPYGSPTYGYGRPSKQLCQDRNKFYYIHVRCRFRLKQRKFPWIHIRGNANYRGTENLYTSDVRYKGRYYRYYYDEDGNKIDTCHEMTFTKPDWELFQETYEILDLVYLDYVWFWCRVGIFDEYINKYKEIKETSEGFLRTLAKLFLNNLYGKFAMSDDSSYKEPYLDEDGQVRFIAHEEHEKTVGYIAIGAAVTSYALNFTIRAAIANYGRFLYADTDSIHILGIEPAKNVVIHPTNFNCWKKEGVFDVAIYERQKTYLEHMVEKDGEKLDEPELIIKCAGMSQSAKQAFIDSGKDITEFKSGLELEDCNLKAKRIKGGILLINKTFKMRNPVDKKVRVAYN